jgi:hypothetical protein
MEVLMIAGFMISYVDNRYICKLGNDIAIGLKSNNPRAGMEIP